MIELREGVWWPIGEDGSWRAAQREIGHVDEALKLCTERRLCVQAGANGGLYPRRLAERFNSVVTFEPDLPNFLAASRNLARSPDVVLYMAALGSAPGSCHMARPDGETKIDVVSNRGALQTRSGGLVPVMTIDQLDLPVCDLIMLDIEGDELLALRGAAQTINRHRPVIVAEDKGLGRRRGDVFGMLSAWLCDGLGYRSAGMFGHDFAFTPCEV